MVSLPKLNLKFLACPFLLPPSTFFFFPHHPNSPCHHRATIVAPPQPPPDAGAAFPFLPRRAATFPSFFHAFERHLNGLGDHQNSHLGSFLAKTTSKTCSAPPKTLGGGMIRNFRALFVVIVRERNINYLIVCMRFDLF